MTPECYGFLTLIGTVSRQGVNPVHGPMEADAELVDWSIGLWCKESGGKFGSPSWTSSLAEGQYKESSTPSEALAAGSENEVGTHTAA
eukprot:9474613-Pyramimonas_sp.AAC.1